MDKRDAIAFAQVEISTVVNTIKNLGYDVLEEQDGTKATNLGNYKLIAKSQEYNTTETRYETIKHEPTTYEGRIGGEKIVLRGNDGWTEEVKKEVDVTKTTYQKLYIKILQKDSKNIVKQIESSIVDDIPIYNAIKGFKKREKSIKKPKACLALAFINRLLFFIIALCGLLTIFIFGEEKRWDIILAIVCINLFLYIINIILHKKLIKFGDGYGGVLIYLYAINLISMVIFYAAMTGEYNFFMNVLKVFGIIYFISLLVILYGAFRIFKESKAINEAIKKRKEMIESNRYVEIDECYNEAKRYLAYDDFDTKMLENFLLGRVDQTTFINNYKKIK